MNRPPEAAPAEWTYSEYARLPDDGNRYEVLDGEVLVTPAPTPRHQRVILRLAMILVEYVEGAGHGWVLQDVDLLFASGHFLRPDLLVLPADARAGLTDRGVELPPALVVEVVSPSSRTVDLERKPRRYLEFGVPEYWAVDPGEEAIRVWDREGGADAPLRIEDMVRWSLPAGAEPLQIPVAELVAPI